MVRVACVTTYFNPAGYRSRLRNYQSFAAALERQGVTLLTAELAVGDDPFQLPGGPGFVRFRGRSRLWMKERLANAAVARLPDGYDAVAWLDGDILFKDDDWLGQLAERFDTADVVQPFATVTHLPPGHEAHRGEDLGSDPGIVAQARLTPDWLAARRAGAVPFGVPGYAWAARRELFEGGGGLYDRMILGNGDAFFADCLLDSFGLHHYSSSRTAGMAADMDAWRPGLLGGRHPRVDWLPGRVFHLWHGRFQDRGYTARDAILRRHDFDPRQDLVREGDLYEWGSDKPGLHAEVAAYFLARREDLA
jgi:hypothetical protein